jgi:hypothetical protein
MPLVVQELPTLPEHMSSSPVLSGVRVTRSLILCVYFVDRCLSFCTLSFGHCVDCSSSIYGFWLPLWYLQTLFPIIYLCLGRLVFFIFIAHHVDLREKKQNSRTYHINFYTRFLLKKMLTSHWFFSLSFRWYRLLW